MIKNTLFSFIIGDALGVPAEFKPRTFLKRVPITNMIGYKSHFQYPGTWSDDTSLTLATLKSLLENNYYLDYNDIMNNFVKWYKNNEFTATNDLFDIGNTTEKSIKNYITYNNYKKCGLKTEKNNGNGSLMRMLPIVYYFIHNNNYKVNKRSINEIHTLSSLTHAHPISCMACSFYVYICLNLYNNKNKKHINESINEVYDYYTKTKYKKFLKFFNRIKNFDEFICLSENEIKSSGFVIDTLEASIYSFLKHDNLKDILLYAVNLGDDTDTVGAITGSLGGFIYNYNDLPISWIDLLKNKELIFEILSLEKNK